MKNILITVSGEYDELGWVALCQTGDAVFLTDNAGQIKFISPSVEPIFGYSAAEMRAMEHISVLLGSDLFERAELEARGEIRDIERIVLTKSGDERHILIHVKAVSIKDCDLLYTCRDITESKSAQETLRETRLELAHASRLALAGQLMGSIAHEVNQPLTSIVSNADAALLKLNSKTTRGDTELQVILSDIHAEGRRAADVVRRLLALVRRQPVKRELVDLNRLVDDTLKLVHGEARRRRILVYAELASSLPPVETDPISLQQVLLNVIVNGMEAMEDVDERERKLEIQTRRTNGSIEITVGDNGHGITAEHLHKVFDPFFTTKVEGLGLGLAIAKSIVEAHGGSICVTPRATCGATSRVTLPCQV